MNRLSLIVLSLSLSACSMFGSDPTEKTATLADLQPAYLPVKNQQLPSANLNELRDLYVAALKASDDQEVRRQVNSRLAGIEMLRSEELLAESTGSEQKLFAATIAAYEALLADNPNDANTDQHLYQLARAHEMNGEQDKSLAILTGLVGEHQDSARYVESQFRLAESCFSAGKYKEAAQSYKHVIARGEGLYYQNSHYMLAWSYFKAAHYDYAIENFMLTLDLMLLHSDEAVARERGDQEIVNDSLRMLSVSFSTLEGVESLNQTLDSMGERRYAAQLYQSLASYYLNLQRYKDSADSYQAFVERYPQADQRYRYQIAQIEVYQQGGFKQEVLQSKINFVADNQHDKSYWQTRSADIKTAIDDSLQNYITELASYYHTLAQQADKKQIAQQRQHYQQAAYYYALFVASFPRHELAADMLFLLAETQYESGSYQAAIASYERVAYHYSHSAKAAEAGYAAILSYDHLPLPAQDDPSYKITQDNISLAKIDSSLRFTQAFPGDSRSPAIQINSAQAQLGLGLYEKAIISASALTPGNALYRATADNSITMSAWLVIAQSAFDTQDYFYAETSYSEVLALLPPKDKRLQALNERYAASIYKQGELALASNQHLLAAQHFTRVMNKVPASSIRVNAQFDAASSYYAIKAWDKAADLLLDFRQRYPQHTLTAGMGATLAVIYQETEQWGLAADELAGVYRNEQDPVKKAQLLYLTAELYEKAANSSQAISYYRNYAHNYKQPFDINLEAMNKLNELYLSAAEDEKRRFWLKRLMQADEQQRSERSRYLAAMASSVFADDAYQSFKEIKLTLPIKKSLQKKKQALNLALQRYQQTAQYGVADFATLSLYRLAAVYGQLSRDLINSERPDSLDELALEQYEILLEEQAYPFEEKAIAIHEQNIQNSWNNIYDDWVKESFTALRKLLPARYNKEESVKNSMEDIY
ncbi:tetratricopeptide repeat protein [Dasania marina]|uniref:tetratricopeptide repeat protein n=1 Tax=Dasania marina TaxID=471499 RepID=UPI000A01593B|nr:tetratricopeptide repeat protein [Dasania marina]